MSQGMVTAVCQSSRNSLFFRFTGIRNISRAPAIAMVESFTIASPAG